MAVDGEQALAFLRKQGAYESAPTPHLILLDLNLPRLDGREVLRLLKSNDRLQHIPVLVLTSSDAPTDILEAYRHGVSAYLRKPDSIDEYLKTFKAIDDFWFRTARNPTPKFFAPPNLSFVRIDCAF